MIWESSYWKADLLRFADQLGRARKTASSSASKTYVSVEKAVLMGAFVVRRLVESHKLSDSTAGMLLRVNRVPPTGKRVTLLNNHRLEELFDFARSGRSRQALPFLCNQAIHSYIFAVYSDRTGKRLAGVFMASDWQRNRALFAVPLAELERAFRKAGSDYPTESVSVFDEKLGDYRVEQRTARRGRRAPARAAMPPR